MAGNVWERCSDYWNHPYQPKTGTDPQGPETGFARTHRQGFRVVAEVLEFFQLFLVRILGVRQNGDVAHGIRESHAAHKLFSGHGFEWLVIWVAHCHASLGVPVFQALDAMTGGQDHASDSLKVVHDWSGGILLLKLAFPSQGDNLHSDGPAVDSSHEVFQ
jgi:hypothetical protein